MTTDDKTSTPEVNLFDFLDWMYKQGYKVKGIKGTQVLYTVPRGTKQVSSATTDLLDHYQPVMYAVLLAGEEFKEAMENIND